jgi:hypothetical protein
LAFISPGELLCIEKALLGIVFETVGITQPIPQIRRTSLLIVDL